jgi:hypothetical protein
MNDPLTAGARDANVPRVPALADDMIAKSLAAQQASAALVAEVEASGLAKAIPTLGAMVENGDVKRLANLARAYAAAEDAVTDEMVSRLTEAVGGGLALIDQVQRSGLERALPALVELVDNGDLQRLVKLARLADTIGTGLSLMDRLSRGGGERIVAMLERLEASGALEKMAQTLPRLLERLDQVHRLLECIDRAGAATAQAAPAQGGVGPLFRTMRDRETQETLNFLLQVGRQMRESCPPDG